MTERALREATVDLSAIADNVRMLRRHHRHPRTPWPS